MLLELLRQYYNLFIAVFFARDFQKTAYPSKPEAKPRVNLKDAFVFSKRSKKKLNTAHPDLIRLAYQVLKYYDHTILEGHRGESLQNHYYREGKTQLRYPKSKHNKKPSRAIDVAPFPIDWSDTERFKELGAIYKRESKKLGIRISWGGDWKTKFVGNKDYPHLELI